ncbi:MAG: GIY-YIG nuclease family protein [Gammaproteobacteria bacterium]|nr:GIY-YIG nuclease family protein [Gammaproteobacteria bacterium]
MAKLKNNKIRHPKKRSNKGALIKGMSQPLPIELLGEPSFRSGLYEIMRDYAGIYALYKRNRLYYVGLATNLYWRLLGHTKNKHKGKWNRFAIFRIGRVRYLKDIETLLLRVAEPPGNVVSGHLHRDADLTRVLRKIQQDQTRRLSRIRKALRR